MIDVAPTLGHYMDAPDSRRVVTASGILPDAQPSAGLQLNGMALMHFATRAEFEKADSGWFWDGSGTLISIRTPRFLVSVAKQIRIALAP